MNNSGMKGVSVRINTKDLDKLKRIAEVLGASDSEVIRYAIKCALRKLTPLASRAAGQMDLLPVFIEHGSELSRAFNICPDRLEQILARAGGECDIDIARKDIELLTISGIAEGNRQMHTGREAGPVAAAQDIGHMLREYLYDKYLSSPQERQELETTGPA
jgi:hypothetical protein